MRSTRLLRAVVTHAVVGAGGRDGDDLRTGVRGELCRERADATGGAHDQHGLPGERLERLDDLECRDARGRQRRRDAGFKALR